VWYRPKYAIPSINPTRDVVPEPLLEILDSVEAIERSPKTLIQFPAITLPEVTVLPTVRVRLPKLLLPKNILA